jgi:hypothetical protein
LSDIEDNIYCPVCGACGEDGCCPPWKCKQGGQCLYPKYHNNFYVKIRRLFYFIGVKIKTFLWNRYHVVYTGKGKFKVLK